MSLVNDTKNKIREAGKIGDINPQLTKDFLRFDRVLKFNISYKNKKYLAIRSQHNNLRGPYKGGLRFSPQVSEDEVKALSMWMSLKTSLIEIPFGGGKGGIKIDSKKVNLEDQIIILDKFIKKISSKIGPQKDILAPDVNTNQETMSWIVESFKNAQPSEKNYRAVTTGKPTEEGGIEGRVEATSWGAFFVLKSYLKKISQQIQNIEVAIHGFGNAAIYYALEIERVGGKVVAVSDSRGGIYNKDGLDIEKVIKIKEDSGKVSNYPDGKKITNNQLLSLNVDYLSLAALENTITKDNIKNIKAKTIVEIANGGVNPNAENFLEENDINLLPDIIVNAGGVFVSYLEWLQNTTDKRFNKKLVKKKLEKKMTQSSNNLWELSTKYEKMPTKTTAYILALKNLEKSTNND